MTRAQLLWLNVSLVLAWAVLIWSLGGAHFGYDDTSRIIGPLLDWLFPAMEAADKRWWLRFVRKLAHVSEYGVFAVLVLRLVLFLGGRRMAWNLAVAVAATLLLALLDEGRQGRLVNRTGSIHDVGLDVFGGSLGLALSISLASLCGRPLLGVPGWPGTAAELPSTPHQS